MSGLAPVSAIMPQLPSAPLPSAATPLAKSAKQFEAIFVREMLAAARKAGMGDTLTGSAAQDNFREMQDARFADIAAERGSFGLARMIERQLAPPAKPDVPPSGSGG